MYLSSIRFKNLRNLDEKSVELTHTLNVFEGENAAGKSSILEGIGFLLTGRSFRTAKTPQLVRFNDSGLVLNGKLSDGTIIGIGFDKGKKTKAIRIDGEDVYSLSKLASLYPVQLLTPESYHLIDSGPNQRRRFFDWLLFHVEHSYRRSWKELNRTLKQRNSYLRSLKGEISSLDNQVLNSWDVRLVEVSNHIDNHRLLILKKIKENLTPILRSMSLSFVDSLSIEYKYGYNGKSLSEKLKDSVLRDIVNRSTSYGAHKADYVIKNNGVEVKESLSRGQKKMLINALFLSQTQLLKEETNRNSLFVIDDFSSELDDANQLQLVKALHKHNNVQVIISCLDSRVLKPLIKEYNSVSMFHVKHGEISKVTLQS